jgi:hypothetical protein
VDHQQVEPAYFGGERIGPGQQDRTVDRDLQRGERSWKAPPAGRPVRYSWISLSQGWDASR